MKETIKQMMQRVSALPLDSEEQKRARQEVIDAILKEVKETPVDPYDPYIFRYYFDNRYENSPALYVTLEGPSHGVLYAVRGRKTSGWIKGKPVLDDFTRLRYDQEIHKGHLLTETEAKDIAQSMMGLSGIDAIKTEIFNRFKEFNHYPPRIVTETPETLIARREEAQKDMKQRGFDVTWLVQKKT